jgi:hypothetical protein
VGPHPDRNVGAAAIRGAPPTGGPDAFSLADPTRTEGILAAAGFTEVTFTDVHEPVYYGRDAAAAFDAVLGLWGVRDDSEQAHQRLRATLEAHHTAGGVYFDSRAWLVTAHRAPRPDQRCPGG